jgi:hypothetical protein
MDISLAHLFDLVRLTLTSPRALVARLLAQNPPMEARWIALGAVVALSALTAWLANALFPVPVETPWSGLTSSPMMLAATQGAGVLVVSTAMAGLGRVFGGRGTFAEALLLAIWLEFMLLCVQVLQVILMLLFPLFATLVGFGALAMFFALLTVFTAELHGFKNLPMVFVGIITSIFLAALALTFVLSILGFVGAAGV